jgi:hypothetical protein
LGIFLLVFVAAAAVLALWLNVRVTRFAPTTMRAATLHVGGSMVACQLISPAISSLLLDPGSPVLRMVSLLCVALPAMVYAVLSVIWIIVQAQGTLGKGMMR